MMLMRKSATGQLALAIPREQPKAKARRGRPHKPDAGVSHLSRPRLAPRFPVHVTLRMKRHVYNLRAWRSYRVLRRALIIGSNRFGMRITHYSVQGNHVHLIVEALDGRALSRGVQGLAIRMAKGLNRMMGKRGKVFADRFHSHILRTPTETRNAVHYVLHNRQHHETRFQDATSTESAAPRITALIVDRFSSLGDPEVVAAPRTWLLTCGIGRAKGGGGD